MNLERELSKLEEEKNIDLSEWKKIDISIENIMNLWNFLFEKKIINDWYAFYDKIADAEIFDFSGKETGMIIGQLLDYHNHGFNWDYDDAKIIGIDSNYVLDKKMLVEILEWVNSVIAMYDPTVKLVYTKFNNEALNFYDKDYLGNDLSIVASELGHLVSVFLETILKSDYEFYHWDNNF